MQEVQWGSWCPTSVTPYSPTTAQQEAQRAQFLVEKAKQEQRQKIVQAEGEAEAARMISFCQRELSPVLALHLPLLGRLMRPRRMRPRVYDAEPPGGRGSGWDLKS